MIADDGDEIVEPFDADCEDAHPPAELLELHEVLEFQAAVDAAPRAVSGDEVREAEGLPPIDPPKRTRKPRKGASE